MENKNNGREAWSTYQLAEAVSVTPATIIDWIEKGLIKASKATINPSSKWVISDDEAQRVIRDMADRPGTR